MRERDGGWMRRQQITFIERQIHDRCTLFYRHGLGQTDIITNMCTSFSCKTQEKGSLSYSSQLILRERPTEVSVADEKVWLVGNRNTRLSWS